MERIWQEFKAGFNEFWSHAVKAAKETPAGFFSPAIWLWKWLRSFKFHDQKENRK